MAFTKKTTAKKSEPTEIETEQTGRKPKNTAAASSNQRDVLPGMIVRKDPTWIPDRAYDETEDTTRQVSLKNDYHYVWVLAGSDGYVNRFKNMGYRLAMYTGGGGLAPGGFQGTNMFERDVNNRVVNGDTVLMYCPHSLFEAYQAETIAMTEKMQQAATEDFHNKSYNMGVRSFEEQTNPNEPGHPAERTYN